MYVEYCMSVLFCPYSWCGVIVYWLLVFVISVAFIAVLIAQFSLSFEELTSKAHVNVIVKKTQIIQRMEDMLVCFPHSQKCVSDCMISSSLQGI